MSTYNMPYMNYTRLLKTLERAGSLLTDVAEIDAHTNVTYLLHEVIKQTIPHDNYVIIELNKERTIELIRTLMLHTARVEDIYFRLRDAKSDGQVTTDVATHDKRIEQAWKKVRHARDVEYFMSSLVIANRQDEKE